jgi:hypothetical protein
MPGYTEFGTAQAIEDAANSVSGRETSKKWGIPSAILHNRLSGHGTRQQSAAGQQRLLPVQERYLASWVLTQGALELPLAMPKSRNLLNTS